MSIYFLFVRHYSLMNYKYNRYFGISRTGDINLLGKVFQYNLPIESGKSFGQIYDNITEYKKWGDTSNPWEFAKTYPDIYWNQNRGLWDGPSFDVIKKFSRTVVFHNIFQYITQSLLFFPQAMLETPFMKPLLQPTAEGFSIVFHFLYYLYQKLQYLTLIILVTFPITFIEFLTKRNLVSAIYTLLGMFCLYQISFAVFFSFMDYGRLIIPVQIFLFLFSFYWWSRIIKLLFVRLKKVRTFLKK